MKLVSTGNESKSRGYHVDQEITPTGPRKILHLLGTAELKGAAICRMVESLALEADAARYQIQACFLEGGVYSERFLRAGIKSTCLDWNGTASDLRGVLRYASLLRSGNFSIIHQHLSGRFLTSMGRHLSRARIVLNLHGRASEQTGEIPSVRHLPPHDALIANSEIVARFSNDPQARVVYPGIDLPGCPATRREHAGVVIGTACRLEVIKGLSHLIEAFVLLSAERADVRLEIAGAGSLRSTLEEQGRRLGISDRIEFLGWRDDLSAVMAGWDIFVLPSLDEGFGVAALEAMAEGLPVIAASVGGLSELVVDGETGFLVPPAAPAELCARMRVLVDDRQKRSAMGNAGCKRVKESFPVSRMISQTFAVYDELLSPEK